MLVLSRREGEGIQLVIQELLSAGTVIVFTVLEVQGSRVRLGIDAPGEVRILREELLPPQKG